MVPRFTNRGSVHRRFRFRTVGSRFKRRFQFKAENAKIPKIIKILKRTSSGRCRARRCCYFLISPLIFQWFLIFFIFNFELKSALEPWTVLNLNRREPEPPMNRTAVCEPWDYWKGVGKEGVGNQPISRIEARHNEKKIDGRNYESLRLIFIKTLQNQLKS